MSIVFDLIEKERQRQEDEVCLIASENYTSLDVMKAQGSVLTNKYAEGYIPGIDKQGNKTYRRYYGGCHIIDEIESYAVEKCKELFKCKYAYVQPHSGSQANQAVYLALCEPGAVILGMSLDQGGHLTHGSPVNASGKLYKAKSYGIDENGIINYSEIKSKLYEYKPRILVVGASAYPRIIDFKKIRKIVDEYNANVMDNLVDSEKSILQSLSYWGEKSTIDDIYDKTKCILMVDMAHIAGLVATGLHQDPVSLADVVTSTTHKTLRGPRGGIILTNDLNIAKQINKSIFPGIQGGPLEHVIAAKAICFEEALKPEFKEYTTNILKNIKAMEKVFKNEEIDMVSGGSDNHLLLLDLRRYDVSGAVLEKSLEEIGIICNKNAVKDDPKPRMETSGVRIGTAAVTTRGFKEEDCAVLANIISDQIKILSRKEVMSEDYKKSLKSKVSSLCKEHPIY